MSAVPDKLARLDPKAPEELDIEFQDDMGTVWGQLTGKARTFRKGSVGYYVTGKIRDPNNPDARYQVSASVVLIGSKAAR